MTVTHTPGVLKKFRRTPWRFQQTIERTGGDIDGVVAVILAAHGELQEAIITLDEVVFETERLLALCPVGSPLPLVRETSIRARTPAEIHELLVAAIGDGPDFICIPTPKPFVFYSDHHDWITFFANTRSHLNHIIDPLSAHGCRLVENWTREL